MTRIGFFLLVAPMLLTGNIGAQTETGEAAWKLPPLQVLIDSAMIHSPMVKLADAIIQMEQYGLTDAQRDWLRKLYIGADTRFGSMFDYTRLQTVSGSGFIMPTINTFNYGIGVSAYMPFSDFFDRKRTIQKANLRVEQAEIQKDETMRGVQQLVISAYYDVVSAQITLATRNEISLSAGILFEQSKLDYAEERITLADYTRANETYLMAQNEQEVQRNTLMKAIHVLEVVVGIELININ